MNGEGNMSRGVGRSVEMELGVSLAGGGAVLAGFARPVADRAEQSRQLGQRLCGGQGRQDSLAKASQILALLQGLPASRAPTRR